jgi:hypothetical protein
MRVLLGLCAVLIACGAHQELPRLTIPQYEQMKASVAGGIGRRYEDHAACRKTATDAKTMIACMQAAGYGYIARSADAQAMECWRLREANGTDPLPEAMCFMPGAAPTE